jgi:ABC-type multidrug transport system permease subunit
VEIQARILKFITRANWVIFFGASLFGFILAPPDFARGIFFGGLLVTINFHLLAKTLKKALTPPHLASHNLVLIKYYIRFMVTGIIIVILIAGHYVNPLGLVIGLSVVVASVFLAALRELKKIILEEAL